MQIHLLVMKEMEPLPENIEVLDDYEIVSIFSNEGLGRILATGRHLLISASEEALKNWLRSFDGIWLGKGQPIFQEFEVAHIK